MEIDADQNPKLRSEKKKAVLKERKNEEKYSTYMLETV